MTRKYTTSVPTREEWILAVGGRKIDAIKAYRNRTGISLAESKNAIDRCIETGVWADDSGIPDESQIREHLELVKYFSSALLHRKASKNVIKEASELARKYEEYEKEYRDSINNMRQLQVLKV